jgi:hypothetical protein
MPIILDKHLYELAKNYADLVYSKPSAYKSLAIQKYYKSLGGRYGEDYKERKLSRWVAEQWQDIGHKGYPVYRPTLRISKDTPLLASEIDKKNLKEQIKKKQIIKGSHNLKPFKRKT